MSQSSGFQILDIKDNFFKTFKLRSGPIIGSGLSGNLVFASYLDQPQTKRAVKIFSYKGEREIKSKRLFVRKVKMMQSVNHPNLMKLIMAVRCPTSLTICVPFYQKGSLSSLLRELIPSHLAVYLTQLTCAVSYLNLKRIVHSDIKPSNILVDDKQNAVLADFGLAFGVPHETEIISSDKIGGTLAFMAPELLTLGNVGTVTFDYLHETNMSPDIPQPYW